MVLKDSPIDVRSRDSAGGGAARWVESADGWLLAGCILSGTMILGPVGPLVLAVAVCKLWKSVKRGTNTRSWAATIIGTFCMIDGLINFSPWSFDTFAHNTVLGQTFITGYGRFFDGAFYLHYNSGALGGVANHSEKMWQYLAVFILMPMRVVSAWAFMQMRTWGLHFMKVSGVAVSLSLGRVHDGDEPGLPGADGQVRIRRRGLVAVQSVLSVAAFRAALPVHGRQEPMVPLSPRLRSR